MGEIQTGADGCGHHVCWHARKTCQISDRYQKGVCLRRSTLGFLACMESMSDARPCGHRLSAPPCMLVHHGHMQALWLAGRGTSRAFMLPWGCFLVSAWSMGHSAQSFLPRGAGLGAAPLLLPGTHSCCHAFLVAAWCAGSHREPRRPIS